MGDEFEQLSTQCNSLAAKLAEKTPSFSTDLSDSVSQVKILLTDILIHLELQSKKLSASTQASSSDIALSMLTMDGTLDPCGKFKKATLAKNLNLRRFSDHCCCVNHYIF